jgi:3-oxoadipyl-CoA thiolase
MTASNGNGSTSNQAFLVAGVRTPFGRYGGELATVRPDDLAAHVLRELSSRLPSVDWDELDDVLIGCANQAGEDNRNVARMATLLAGLPISAPGGTVNRLCGSSLDAIAIASRAVRSGDADLVLAGGVESMSRAPFVIPKATSAFSRATEIHDTTIGWRFVNPAMAEQFGTDSMPETADNVAEEFGISRADQDAFALRSQERTAKAIASGRLAREIAPVTVPQRRGEPVVVDTDEHPRATSLAALAKLKPINPGGTVTAGTASGINDGAAAVLIASEPAVQKYGLTPLARVTSAAVAGVLPRIMGIGPVPATQKLLSRNGLTIDQLDLVELNEAFAAQALGVLRRLGLPDDAEHVNPNGGAIALGHPLGASGARIALSAAIELHDRGDRRALATMCIGVGQGISVLLESA